VKGGEGKCLQGGMDGFLTKPIGPNELDVLLERYKQGVSRRLLPV
jgi:CheY-like chemotaxis protein